MSGSSEIGFIGLMKLDLQSVDHLLTPLIFIHPYKQDHVVNIHFLYLIF